MTLWAEANQGNILPSLVAIGTVVVEVHSGGTYNDLSFPRDLTRLRNQRVV